MLRDKKILLGITGSIAAYKAAHLCRLFIKAGAEVKIIMTQNATSFITPLTLSTLSGHEVHTNVMSDGTWNNHVELGLWADLMVIAPCTATTMGKMVNGIADNAVVACYLSAKCNVMVAPAMDLDMWAHPSTVANLAALRSYGNFIIPVGHGYLASGLVGDGRMAESEDIVDYVNTHLGQHHDLKGTNVLITAGPTYEAIDPVRFIGNRSTGKQGVALAEECASRGANVTLVLGPSDVQISGDSINVCRVESAADMYQEADKHFQQSDLVILAAAVADYKSVVIATQKLKKKSDEMSIELEKTIDIASTLGNKKSEKQCIVGFALETNDEIEHAKGKLHKKNLDFIVLNSLNDKGAGFAHETNKIMILSKDGIAQEFDLKSKREVAKDIIDFYVTYINR
jgi:phosphopantothenoylcysteine decarboxylase / phosphopantothenate---cysteine ligase